MDIDQAAYVLMRAGVFCNDRSGFDRARKLAAEVILSGHTGDRYDLDDGQLTPDQYRSLYLLIAENTLEY